ncbi:MAG: D-alanine--D-alanine ligase, partial [Pseudomonadota bacterium]
MDQAPQHFSKPNAGLPPLDPGASAMSPFEFMSPKLFYIPVVGYALYLMLKHRSITVPTLANPAIFAGGAIGERKSDVLNLAGNYAKTHIAPFVVVDKGAAQATFENAMAALSASEIAFPIVAKPDTGLRGAGVRPINTAAELRAYIEDFPAQRTIMLQKKVEHSAEAGVFYIRRPKQPTGEIFSLTLKYTSTITGDGTRTIGDLIDACPRSFKLRDLYRTRHHAVLDHVLPKGEERAINFAGNHAKGAIFRDGAKHITPAMTHAFDTVAKDFPDLHFARFDVRFETLEKLKQGG